MEIFLYIFSSTEIYLLHEISIECVQLITILVLGCMTGFLIKLSDDISDKKTRLNILFSIPPGIAYGLFMGYMMISDVDAAFIFAGIIIGCLVTGKINSTCHYLGLSAILGMVFSYGIKLSPLVFIIAFFAALDEMKELIRISSLDFMFKYRLFLKIGVMLLVFFELIGINALFILLFFDMAYILTGRFDSRLIHEI